MGTPDGFGSVLGIDIGGGSVKSVVVTGGEIRSRSVVPRDRSVADLLDRIVVSDDHFFASYQRGNSGVRWQINLFHRPAHPYTQVLLESIPVPDPSVAAAGTTITGEPPSPDDD